MYMPFCKTSGSARIHNSGSPVTQKETSHWPSQALAPTMELFLFQENVEPLTTQKESTPDNISIQDQVPWIRLFITYNV